MPKITIITPVYIDTPEKADWLLETMQSVQSQSITDWEMILVNDKSSLPIGEARYKWSDDIRIRWFDLAENSGPALARNLAVALAESDCLVPLDADDMFPEPTTLEDMYDAWLMDKKKIIYGNIQFYNVNRTGQFQRNPNLFSLPEYNFDDTKVMLNGAMTVTSMHSIDCHHAIGGWKSDFTYGLEDVEYWYAAGLAGYCGSKIPVTTLLYRKHPDYGEPTSRTEKLKANMQYRVMQDKIINLHTDAIKKGVYPMGCCGGNKQQANLPVSNDPIILSGQSKAAQGMIVPLQGDFKEEDTEWVAYMGERKGRFDILAGPVSYTIFGTGQIFQIHKAHRDIFVARQRLKFVMNQQDPRTIIEEETESIVQLRTITRTERPQTFTANPPELPIVERIDQIAAKTRQIEIVEAPDSEIQEIISSFPQAFSSDTLDKNLDLTDLKVSAGIIRLLDQNDWTVEKIATTTPKELTVIPGIGVKRANQLIEKAQGLI